MKGELSDEEDKEKYCVDFFRKGYEQDESLPPQSDDVSQTVPPENEGGDNDASDLFNIKSAVPGRTAGAVDKVEHKRFIRYGIYVLQVLFVLTQCISFLVCLETVSYNNSRFYLLTVPIRD